MFSLYERAIASRIIFQSAKRPLRNTLCDASCAMRLVQCPCTGKLNSDSGREGCLIFFLELTKGAIFDNEETQSPVYTFYFEIEARDFMTKFLANAIVFFPEFHPRRWLRFDRNSSSFASSMPSGVDFRPECVWWPQFFPAKIVSELL